jgi:hypothetical protein
VHPGALAALKCQTGNTELVLDPEPLNGPTVQHHAVTLPQPSPRPFFIDEHYNESMVRVLPFTGSLGCSPKSAKWEPEEGKALTRKKRCTRPVRWCSMRVHGMPPLRVANKSRNVHNSCCKHHGTQKGGVHQSGHPSTDSHAVKMVRVALDH